MAGRRRKSKNQLDNQSGITQIKLSDSYVSLLLGIFVVIILSISVLTYLKQKNTKHQEQQTSSARTEEQPKPVKKTVTLAYTVSEGDDLKSIAAKFYGTEDNYDKIIKANNIQNPDIIAVGTVLQIPDVVQETTQEQPAQPTSTKKITDSVYVVKNNESLWDIAVRSYGDGYRWVDIAKANNLQNPDVLIEGTILKIPR